MDDNFLDKLKKTLDEGEFNSDAANLINQIHEAAENVNTKEVEEKVEKQREEAETKPKTQDELNKAKNQYEEKITQLRKLDEINRLLVDFINLEAYINDSLEELKNMVLECENNFIEDGSEYDELRDKINSIKKQFNF
jgi:hypothetical protein